MKKLRPRVPGAVRHFWKTRSTQRKRQGSATGQKDYGSRSAVTGGAQLDGFINLFKDLLIEAGLPKSTVFTEGRTSVTIPGFFRPTKNWDLIVLVEGKLFACLELKSQVGSFGNNFNNRAEEAVGNAEDLLRAYRYGAYNESPKPWTGYFMLLEKAKKSTSPVKLYERHFPVFECFKNTSYAQRYELLCKKLQREGLYDSTCLLLSNKSGGLSGKYSEPSKEVGIENFAMSLISKAIAYKKIKGISR
jgi:hypothetical protein